ncbi:MAG: Ig-like domain-containing protein [Candidatus Hodarchaeota archaeon]
MRKIRRKKIITLLIVSGFVCLFCFLDQDRRNTQVEIPDGNVEESTTWNFDWTIPLYDYRQHHAYRAKDSPLMGSFTAEGPGVKFFICNSGNYSAYASGGVATVEVLHNLENNLDWTFVVPYTDTWYCVYEHFMGFDSRRVYGWHGIDNEAPDISPNFYDGKVISGVSTLYVSATDHYGVARLEIRINGTMVVGRNSATASYSWDTTSIALGDYSIQVYARDILGNSETSTFIVTVEEAPLDDEKDPTSNNPEVPGYNPILALFAIIIGSAIIIFRYHKLRK